MRSGVQDDAGFERTPLLGQATNASQAECVGLSCGAEQLHVARSEEECEGDVGATEEREVEDAEPPTFEILLIMSSTWIGVFLAAADISIMATLSAPISSSLNAFSIFTWLILAYAITSAAVQPLCGQLTDIFGRRLGLVCANIPFLLGTIACAAAKSSWVFILGRAVTGIGGGAILPIASFLTSDLVPLRSRGIWFSLTEVVFGAGYSLGGPLGGWIAHVYGWRWAFLGQIPIIVLSMLLVSLKCPKQPLKTSEESFAKRIDAIGSITLTSAIVFFLLGATMGGNVVPWRHPTVYLSLPLSALMFVSFYFIESRIAFEPVIPMSLLTDRSVFAACLTIFLQCMASFTAVYYLPLFLQVQGLSEEASGLRLLGQAAGILSGSLGSGLILHATGRYLLLCVASQILMATAAGLFLCFIDLSVADWPPFVLLFMLSTGFNGAQNITRVILVISVDHSHHAAITSVSYTVRSLGSVFGLTLSSTIFQNLLRARLWSRLGHVKNAADLISRLKADIKQLNHLSGGIKIKALNSYMDAFRGIWLYMFLLLISSVACSLFIRENTLNKTKSRT